MHPSLARDVAAWLGEAQAPYQLFISSNDRVEAPLLMVLPKEDRILTAAVMHIGVGRRLGPPVTSPPSDLQRLWRMVVPILRRCRHDPDFNAAITTAIVLDSGWQAIATIACAEAESPVVWDSDLRRQPQGPAADEAGHRGRHQGPVQMNDGKIVLLLLIFTAAAVVFCGMIIAFGLHMLYHGATR